MLTKMGKELIKWWKTYVTTLPSLIELLHLSAGQKVTTTTLGEYLIEFSKKKTARPIERRTAVQPSSYPARFEKLFVINLHCFHIEWPTSRQCLEGGGEGAELNVFSSQKVHSAVVAVVFVCRHGLYGTCKCNAYPTTATAATTTTNNICRPKMVRNLLHRHRNQ